MKTLICIGHLNGQSIYKDGDNILIEKDGSFLTRLTEEEAKELKGIKEIKNIIGAIDL